MSRFNEILSNFSFGEVSKRVYSLVDTKIYKNSCRKVVNMLPIPQGGMMRRSGTKFLRSIVPTNLGGGGSVINQDRTSLSEVKRLVTFRVSENESYILHFYIDSSDKLKCRAYNVGDDLWYDVRHDAGAEVPRDLVNQKTVTPEILEEMHVVQRGDVLFVAHKDIPPFYLVRDAKKDIEMRAFHNPLSILSSSGRSSTISDTQKQLNAWGYYINRDSSINLQPASTSGSTTITASSNIFEDGMVGVPVAILESSLLGYAKITNVQSSTKVDVDVIINFQSTSAKTSWAISSWSDAWGWPRTCTFWSSYFVLAGTDREPAKVWKSQKGDIFEFSNTRTLDPGDSNTAKDPFGTSIGANNYNRIQWAASLNASLLVGTEGEEYSILAFEEGNINIKKESSHGSLYVQPVAVSNSLYFVQKSGKKIRTLRFNFDIDGFVSENINLYNNNILETGERLKKENSLSSSDSRVKHLAYQEDDNNILWVIDNNGYLTGVTLESNMKVSSWHRHEIGTGGNDPLSFARVKSITVTGDTKGRTENLYMLVERDIGSVGSLKTVTYFEKMYNPFDESKLNPGYEYDSEQPIFVDSAKVFHLVDTEFFAPYDSSKDAEVADGSVTATKTGSPTITNNELKLGGGDYLDYGGTDNADFPQSGTVAVSFRLQNVNTSPEQSTLVNISKASGDTTNQILLYHLNQTSTHQKLGVVIKDKSDSNILSEEIELSLNSYAMSHNQYLKFELNYDLSGGDNRVFLNGKLLKNISATGDRDSNIGLIRVGADASGSNSVYNGAIKDVTIRDQVTHTGEHDSHDVEPKDTSIKSMEHLNEEDVGVLGDGNYLGTKDAVGGQFSLDNTHDVVIAGLLYRHTLIPQHLEAGGNTGTSQGAIKRVDRLVLRFFDTAACSFGPDENTLDSIQFRDPSAPMGNPISLFTGEKVLEFQGGYDRQEKIVISDNVPLPCNVSALIARGLTYEV